jgi:hypothetical protein
MHRLRILAIQFRPSVAVARLGDSPAPLEAFTWIEDPRLFGAARTVIEPSTSLEVLANGAVEPYRPGSIRFRDGQLIRAVCPFLELVADTDDGETSRPLTGELLEDAGVELSQIRFRVEAANRKAQRRTGEPSCAFEARLEVHANDHERHDLLAWTHSDDPNPLVFRDRPIWLGAFQVMRPVRRKNKYKVSTDTIRVRFTPGRGAVYGPPSAVRGQVVGSRSVHEIVPEENRILNPESSWCQYNFNRPSYPPPLPPDVYEGDLDLDIGNDSFGVVDDTCDALITASFSTFLVPGPLKRPTATARVVVAPPHYSPDRRHLYSVAEDLADRDPDSAPGIEHLTPEKWLEAVSDLFRRIWETASTVNLERHRDLNLTFNAGQTALPKFPAVDNNRSMTKDDKIDGQPLMSERFVTLADQEAGDGITDAPMLPKAEYARMRHGELAVPKVLLEFMLQNPQRFKEILRPPFRRMSDPEVDEKNLKPTDFRDPRIGQSYLYDARMPPFLRDCDFSPLSLTRRQYDLLFATDAKGQLLIELAHELLRNT